MAKFTGGEVFAQRMRELAELVSQPGTVRIGFLEGAKYPDGTPVAMIAAIQDFGAPRAGIPPRPFFRNMIADKRGEWPDGVAVQLRETGYDVRLTLERTGQAIAGQLRQSIQDTNEPPLAASTIRRKGFDKPLIDTGHLFNSVDYEVEV